MRNITSLYFNQTIWTSDRQKFFWGGRVEELQSAPERLTQFYRLRQQTHLEMESIIERRIAERSIPAEQKLVTGAFVEQLEPQVRDARALTAARNQSLLNNDFESVVSNIYTNSFSIPYITFALRNPDVSMRRWSFSYNSYSRKRKM